MRHVVFLLAMLCATVSAYAYTSYEERVRRVEAIAKRNPDFSKHHEVVVEAAGVCGAGHYYYVKKGQFSATELGWLRQLLSYRFNGTTVAGTGDVRIDLEESTEQQVTDEELSALMESKGFSEWVGTDILRSLSQLKTARRQLVAATRKHPPVPEQFLGSKVFKRYFASANGLYVRLAAKYKVISIDNLVDCD